jgi:hypothetical protein
MNSTEFCYWLRGWMELTRDNSLTNEQLKVVQRHLDLVLPCATVEKKVPRNRELDFTLPEGSDASRYLMPKSGA